MKTIGRKEFLKQLYQFCEGELELRALPSKRQRFFGLGDFKGIDAFCKTHAQENVFFSVATRNGGGTKEHIYHVPAVWIDLDFKNCPRAEATKRLTDFPLRPTLCVESGHGYHVYWQLKEVYGRQDIEAIEVLLRQLARSLQADPAPCDASRVLRLPDTKNYKYDPPRPVKCILARDVRYDLSDFEFLPDADATGPLGPAYNNCNNTIYTQVGHQAGQENDRMGQKRDRAGQSGTPLGFTEGHRDNTLFHLANQLVKSRMPTQEIEIYLNFIASKCTPPFSEKEIPAKIKSALNRAEREKTSLSTQIEEFVSGTLGWFSGTDVDKFLESGTKRDRQNRRKKLIRMAEAGIIERHPTKDGVYRRIDKDMLELDLTSPKKPTFDIKWPFGIESLVKMHPGTVAVVAGEINSGKTALLLNVAKMNMDRHEIHYFTSELGEGELQDRIRNFDDVTLSDWRVRFWERDHDFDDVIKPNAINIIDYIEIYENHFLISQVLKKIHNALNEGLAIAAIQKNPETDHGMGGHRSAEVARLYLAMSQDYPGGRIKIVKGKNWAVRGKNPNHLSVKYKIRNGCELIQMGEWERK